MMKHSRVYYNGAVNDAFSQRPWDHSNTLNSPLRVSARLVYGWGGRGKRDAVFAQQAVMAAYECYRVYSCSILEIFV